MSHCISKQSKNSKFSWASLLWTLLLYALTFLLLALIEHYLSRNGFDLLASGLWYFPELLTIACLPVFIIRMIARKIFKIGELQVGDRVEILHGEHCGFTGSIQQIFKGQDAIRVIIETISGTKIDCILKHNQCYKLPANIESKTLSI